MSIPSDNLRVGLRVRPLLSQEQQLSPRESLMPDKVSNSVTLLAQGRTYTYDFVADQHTTQEEIFLRVGKPITDLCFQGFNGSIFAYGQAGAGKTYTIMGDNPNDASRGLLPRCCEYIFKYIGNNPMTISFLEIYQEQIYDLLTNKEEILPIREDNKQGVYVDGLTSMQARSLTEAIEILLRGCQNRRTAETSTHKASSRSHSIFTISIDLREISSKLHLVDLAGSERQKQSKIAAPATKGGIRLKEAGKINKSLSALGIVISNLAEGRTRHICYRDSKLTFLLKEAIGGNAKTYIITNISPDLNAIGETMSALQFAARAKSVKIRATLNQDPEKSELEWLRAEVERLRKLLGGVCPLCNGEGKGDDIAQVIGDSTMVIDRLNEEVEGYKKRLEETDRHGQNERNKLTDLINELRRELELYKKIAARLGDGDAMNIINSVPDTIEAYKRTIESLKRENKSLNDTNEELMKRVEDTSNTDEFQDILGILQREVENYKKTNAQIKEENNQYLNEIDALKRKVRELEFNYGKAKQEIDKYREMINALKLCLNNDQTKRVAENPVDILNFLRDDLEHYKGMIDQHKAEMKSLADKNKNLLNSRKDLIDKNKKLEEIIESNKRLHENLKALLDEDQRTNDLEEDFRNALNDLKRNKKARQDLSRYKEMIAALKACINTDESRRRPTDNPAEVLNFVKEDIENYKNLISEQRQELKNLAERQNSFKTSNKESMDIIKKLEDDLDSFRRVQDDLKSLIKDKYRSNDILEDFKNMTNELKRSKKAAQDLSALKDLFSSLKYLINTEDNKYRLSEEPGEIINSLKEDIDTYRNTISKQRQELKDLTNKQNTFKQHKKESKERLRALEDELNAHKMKQEHLKSMLGEEQKTNDIAEDLKNIILELREEKSFKANAEESLSTMKKLLEEVEHYKDIIAELEQENKKIVEAEKSKKKMDEALGNSQKMIGDLKSNIENYKKMISQLKEETGKSADENNDLKIKLRDTEQGLKKNKQELARYKDMIFSFKSSLNNEETRRKSIENPAEVLRYLKEDIEHYKDLISEQRQELRNLTEKQNSFKSTNKECLDAIKKLEDEIDYFRRVQDNLKGLIEDKYRSENIVEDFKNVLNDLKRSKKTKKEFSVLKEVFSSLKFLINTEENKYRVSEEPSEIVDSLKEDIETYRNTISRQRQELKELTDKQNTIKNLQHETKNYVKKLEEELGQQKRVHENLKSLLDEEQKSSDLSDLFKNIIGELRKIKNFKHELSKYRELVSSMYIFIEENENRDSEDPLEVLRYVREDLEKYRNLVSQQRRDLKFLTDEQNTLKQHKKDTKAKVKKLEGELTQHRKTQDYLNSLVGEEHRTNNLADDLKNLILELKKEKSTKHNAEESLLTINKLVEEVDYYKNLIVQLELEVNRIKENKSRKKKDTMPQEASKIIDEMSYELENYKQMIVKLEIQVSKLSNENVELLSMSKKAENYKGKAARMKKDKEELIEMNRKLMDKDKELMDRNKALADKVKELVDRNVDTLDSSEVGKKYQYLCRQVEDFVSQVKNHERIIAKIMDKNIKLKQENRELQEKCWRISGQNRSLVNSPDPSKPQLLRSNTQLPKQEDSSDLDRQTLIQENLFLKKQLEIYGNESPDYLRETESSPHRSSRSYSDTPNSQRIKLLEMENENLLSVIGKLHRKLKRSKIPASPSNL